MSLLRTFTCLLGLLCSTSLLADDLSMTLRYQDPTELNSDRFHQLTREESWKPRHTAIIVCDMWDLHHCRNAVLREQEFAPRLNEVLNKAREQGVIIIHAPSGCMKHYQDHPARTRAQLTPKASHIPDGITSWCYQIPAEEQGIYPVDQSDGGEDDDPQEHADWAKRLESRGLNPRAPWTRQTEALTIDPDKDFISDQGDEVWSILAAADIDNVILAGVHTNMCVLGRPFGLRQLAKNGKNVVLMRDMTDTMYNPGAWPFVSHFSGTDRIISHIEKYVCPTVTSDQIVGGESFRFAKDDRPHVVVVMAEDEYDTNQTLPEFATHYLGKDFRVSYVFGNAEERNDIPGLDLALESADAVLLSVRRRALPTNQMVALRKFIAAGKPVIGIRTACHAFSLRGQDAPDGTEAWDKFDPEVFGGNYHNHHNNKLTSQVSPIATAKDHPILTGVSQDSITQYGSLYKTSPLAEGTTVLLRGKIEEYPAEPVAWTFQRADGGQSFFTSLGHKTDFENPSFQRMLLNSVYWATGLKVPREFDLTVPTPPAKKI